MELEKQVCSLELSKQLKELGVKQDSLFYWYEDYNSQKIFLDYNELIIMYRGTKKYSAFTVAELGELLQKNITINNINRCLWYSRSHNILELYYNECSKKHIITIVDDKSEANARAKMLIYLLENKLM